MVKIYDPQDFPSYLPKLNNLYDDLFSNGKGFRSKLVRIVSARINLRETQTLLLSQTIEFIHNASLLHDDLIDRAPLRRSKTTAWLKYSPEYAVLAGDYLLARVMLNLSKFGNLKLIQFTAEMISDLLEGEWIQDSLVHDFDIKLSQLDRVHNLKTGSLFKWCLLAPFLVVEDSQPEVHELIKEMGSILGLLFQRSDDLLDFDVRNYEDKIILGDLKSGYLNSFSVFLLDGISDEVKAQFVKSQSLEELKRIIGEKYFEKRLTEFDQLNSKLIDLYLHLNQRIKTFLKTEQAQLSEDLLPLSNALYWRKNK